MAQRRRVKRISRKRTLDTDTAVAYTYAPTFGTIERDRTIQIIRDEADRYAAFDPSIILIVRGKGGTKEYARRWWSGPRLEAGEIQRMSDDDLRDTLYGLRNPAELDIYARIG